MGSRSVSEDPEEPEAPFHIRDRVSHEVNAHMQRDRNEQRARDGTPRREVFRIGRRTIPSDGTMTPQALHNNENRPTSDIELAIPTKKESESATDVTPSSGSKHSSSKDVQKEGSVNEES